MRPLLSLFTSGTVGDLVSPRSPPALGGDWDSFTAENDPAVAAAVVLLGHR